MLRGLPILFFCLVAALVSGPVLSQAYPARPVKLVVPLPPGGVTDFLGRLLAQEMSKGLGQPVLVENRPGGGSTIGVGLVAKAPPHGYSIGLGSSSGLAINVALIKLPYDPVKDLAPTSLVSRGPYVFGRDGRSENRRAFLRPMKSGTGGAHGSGESMSGGARTGHFSEVTRHDHTTIH